MIHIETAWDRYKHARHCSVYHVAIEIYSVSICLIGNLLLLIDHVFLLSRFPLFSLTQFRNKYKRKKRKKYFFLYLYIYNFSSPLLSVWLPLHLWGVPSYSFHWNNPDAPYGDLIMPFFSRSKVDMSIFMQNSIILEFGGRRSDPTSQTNEIEVELTMRDNRLIIKPNLVLKWVD